MAVRTSLTPRAQCHTIEALKPLARSSSSVEVKHATLRDRSELRVIGQLLAAVRPVVGGCGWAWSCCLCLARVAADVVAYAQTTEWREAIAVINFQAA